MYFLLDVSYWLVLVVSVPADGFRVRTYIVFHDCAHGSFLPWSKANEWLGASCGLLVFTVALSVRILKQYERGVQFRLAVVLDVQTEEWGIKVTVAEVRDTQLPESMRRAMARQAEAEREKRAKIIAAQGEALAAGELATASDVMFAHPLALQLRNLRTLIEISVDKNSTVVFRSR